MPPIPLIPPAAPPAGSGRLVIMASDVHMSEATPAASWRAVRVTFRGSIIPAYKTPQIHDQCYHAIPVGTDTASEHSSIGCGSVSG